MSVSIKLPPQAIPYHKKNEKWRKQHLDWAESKSSIDTSHIRKTLRNKKINFDLVNGKLNMNDLHLILNPNNINASFITDRIQHYPIINSKLNILRGEEADIDFDFNVIVTNPTAISEKENQKKNELHQKLKELIEDSNLSEEEFNREIDKLDYHYRFEWQDDREMRANFLVRHYQKEQNFDKIFNDGIMDAMIFGEEHYQCDIVGGEPVLSKIDTFALDIYSSSHSNRTEDADIIVLRDYISLGQIVDIYHEELTEKQIKDLENFSQRQEGATDEMDNYDATKQFVFVGEDGMFADADLDIDTFSLFEKVNSTADLLPYDTDGNFRRIRMFWKSRRQIKKVKQYDPETGSEEYNFFPETYQIDVDAGEEEQIFYINESWEATKINDIYLNMRPRLIQYNRLSNPSLCHHGIIGTIYTTNGAKPFSMVDMMKPYNYLYNVIHDRLNKTISDNWGKIIDLDIATVPKGWEIDKWMYYARVHKVRVRDSFKEGDVGAATGRLAGGLSNQSGVLDAEQGNYIQQQINLLEFIKMEMGEAVGITKQREGQIANRETVGGIERSTLQSSHITKWVFFNHDDTKKRAIECFLETVKVAIKGRNKKFQYILPDKSLKMVEIDGDAFSEADYGLVVDNRNDIQELKQKIEGLAHAALQNQSLTFSTIMKLYTSSSAAEKQRMIEQDEAQMREQQQQQVQAEQEAQQVALEQEVQRERERMEMEERINIRDNETKILIKQMDLSNDGIQEVDPSKREDLLEKIRQFDEKLKLEKEKFDYEKVKHKDLLSLKRQTNKTTLQ